MSRRKVRQAKSLITKHSIGLESFKTSVSLEPQFWNALKSIATARGMTTTDLVAAINADRQNSNLSSAIRVFVLNFYSTQAD